MRKAFLLGTGLAALCATTMSHPLRAATIDDVVARLDALERSNAKLAKENALLRDRVNHMGTPRAAATAVAPASPKGNAVLHAAVAPSPAPVAEHTVVSIGGAPLYSKAPGSNPFIDNTTVTLYGHVDLSGDIFNAGVYDQGTKFGVSSNLTYFGVRARHNLDPYGYPGWAAIAQFESLVEVAAVPTERAAFGTRDSFLGMESPWGTIKAGKADTPYKRATSKFDPFSATLGDYNSIMGNTGGDLRAEFDWRASHAIWYESPIWNGFQAAVMVSPGQNTARDNSDYALGDFNCPGTSSRGSGSGFPATSPPQGCTDGSYGNLYSASLTYNQAGFTGIAAYELHEGTNRTGDEGAVLLTNGTTFTVPAGAVGIANEWAAKVGAGYKFNDMIGTLQLYGIYEVLRREHTVAAFNERARDGYFLSATQTVDKWDVSASWAHANASPGSPGTGTNNTYTVAAPAPAGTADFALNTVDSSADMYALGVKYHFSPFVSWYLVGSYLRNGPGAHYCLGVSGHGYGVCGRDANNNVVAGNKTEAVTTGMTFDF
ncbi:Outer membrane protein (porin) [Bradyrhizobium sp. Ghvi]|uniref:porin n=1 Tax=Bradyrhizobium sp. Ghvi TaxID=1855319 RepID=UPI0008ED3BD8|nr:porin [Bradyrhizobium sp. Ghvi]SFO36093.1 Outer membrane protein (porin) [Bradyrhizobium sp. Ghvi]